jgi:hypothetical protein
MGKALDRVRSNTGRSKPSKHPGGTKPSPRGPRPVDSLGRTPGSTANG